MPEVLKVTDNSEGSARAQRKEANGATDHQCNFQIARLATLKAVNYDLIERSVRWAKTHDQPYNTPLHVRQCKGRDQDQSTEHARQK